MLSIAQVGQQFHYIVWKPTTTGPVIHASGVKTYKQTDLSSSIFFESLFTEIVVEYKIKIPIIHISLDMDSVHISESMLPKINEFQKYNNWIDSISYDDKFSDRFESFHYPFYGSQKKYFSIHVSKEIKFAIINAIKKCKYELRYFSLGIFSAEIGARYLFKTEKLSSYIIWRIGKYNMNEILYIQKNNLKCYLRFRRISNKCKLKNYYGSSRSTDKILKQLENCSGNNFINLKIGNKIYFYSVLENQLEVRKMSDKNNDRIQHLNPTNFIQFSSNYPESKPSIFAETAIAFKGFDV